jgi:hypothetical protein
VSGSLEDIAKVVIVSGMDRVVQMLSDEESDTGKKRVPGDIVRVIQAVAIARSHEEWYL